MQDREKQSFALVLEEANGGRPHKVITERWNEMVDKATDLCSQHEAEWAGSMTLKVKFKVDPTGQVEMSFTCSTECADPPLPKARMYYDPDARALVSSPAKVQLDKQVTIYDNVRPAKSAAAPKE